MLNWLFLNIPIYMGATPAECDADQAKRFLGIFPTWYEYITNYGPQSGQGGSCGFGSGMNLPDFAVPIGLAIIDIMLRAGALAAVIFIIIGGYRYMSSQGEPKNIEAAMATIVNAAIGLGIVILATVIVSFIGNALGG